MEGVREVGMEEGEARGKGEEETGDLVLSKKCFWPSFCARGPRP